MWLGYVGGSWVIVANLTLIINLKPVLNGAWTFIVLFCSQKSVLLLGFVSFPVRLFHFFETRQIEALQSCRRGGRCPLQETARMPPSSGSRENWAPGEAFTLIKIGRIINVWSESLACENDLRIMCV